MLKVKIKNFQSVADTSFEINGFTVIVGKNNRGKSAIVRAIDAALSNRLGNDYIRWGKTQTEVNLVKDDLDISWIKGETSSYKIKTGQEKEKPYTSLNKTVPKPITDAGFKKFEIADEKLNPLIAHQFEELFLINRSGPFVTEAISTIYDLNDINEADSICQKRLRSSKSLIKTRQSDLEAAKEKIEKFKGLAEAKTQWDEIKKLLNRSQDLQKEVAIIESLIINLKTRVSVVEKLKAVNILKTPELKNIENKMSEYTWLDSITANIERMQSLTNNLKGVPSLTVPDTQKLSDIFQEMSIISSLTEKLKTTVLSCNRCKKFLDSLKEHETITERINTTQEQVSVFSSIVKIEEGFFTQVRLVKELKSSFEKVLTEWTTVKAEFGEFKTCPLCNSPLTEIHTHE